MSATTMDRPGQQSSGSVPSSANRRGRGGARGNWRIGFVMGLRDARKHRGRSALIMAMIGLPVMALVAGLSYFFTDEISLEESLPARLGTTAAAVSLNSDIPQALAQDPYDRNTSSLGPAKPVPGHRPGPYSEGEISSITGSPVVPLHQEGGYVRLAGRSVRTPGIMQIDGDDLTRTGLGSLVSGRFASGSEEITVTPDAVRAGVPASGDVQVRVYDSDYQTYRVVGVVEALTTDFRPPWFVAPFRPLGAGQTTYLVERSEPVTWSDVQAWNAYGLEVVSRAVIEDPPPTSAIHPEVRTTFEQQQGIVVATLLVIGVMVETTLLAGPAFAVSAARRRRSLALASATGADQRQLRQYVVAQAFLLGAGAAVAGALVGLAIFGGYALLLRRPGEVWANTPLDVPWLIILGVVALAIVAAGVAALLPARGLGRLDVADALIGRNGRGRVRGSFPWLGLALVIAGATLAISVSATSRGQLVWWVGYLIGLGAVTVLVGALLALPALLQAVGPGLGRLSLSLRLAARDGVRQQSRTIPAIAAVMAATAAITGLAINDGSTERQYALSYQPQAVFGRGVVYGGGFDSTGSEQVAEIRRDHSDWRVVERRSLGTSPSTGVAVSVGIQPAGCTAEQVLVYEESSYQRCGVVGGQGALGRIGVTERAAADPAAVLTSTQLATLNADGILVAEPGLIQNGRVRLVTGQVDAATPNQVTGVRTIEIPAVAVRPELLDQAFPQGGFGAWMRPGAAASRRVPTTLDRTEFIAPSGTISESDQVAISDQTEYFYVERGYERPPNTVTFLTFGIAGFLVLVAALVATALSQVESRADLATLAALGSTVALRRRLAAAQAALIAVVGTVLGILVGLPLGVATAITAIGSYSGSSMVLPPVVVVLPWLGFAILLLVVPALAISVAALGVRRAPAMTRRLD